MYFSPIYGFAATPDQNQALNDLPLITTGGGPLLELPGPPEPFDVPYDPLGKGTNQVGVADPDLIAATVAAPVAASQGTDPGPAWLKPLTLGLSLAALIMR